MNLKVKLKDMIDSVVLGRPVYLCELTGQLGVVYHKVSINNHGIASNSALNTLPLTPEELAEAKKLIEKARVVFEQRVLLQEKQNALYNDLIPVSFKANVNSQITSGKVILGIEVIGNPPTLDSLDNLLLTFKSELGVNYHTGVVTLVRHAGDKFSITIDEDKIRTDTSWVKNANGIFTITRTSYHTDDIKLLGPSVPING